MSFLVTKVTKSRKQPARNCHCITGAIVSGNILRANLGPPGANVTDLGVPAVDQLQTHGAGAIESRIEASYLTSDVTE